MANQKKQDRVINKIAEALIECAKHGTGMYKWQMVEEFGCSMAAVNQALGKLDRMLTDLGVPLVLGRLPVDGGTKPHLYFLSSDVTELTYKSRTNKQHIAARTRTEERHWSAINECVEMTGAQKAYALEMELNARHDHERADLRVQQLAALEAEIQNA